MSVKVLALLEHRDGRPVDSAAEVAALAAELSGGDWAGLAVLGPDDQAAAEPLARLAPKLHTLSADFLAPFNPLAWITPLKSALAELEPSLVVMAHTPQALDLAPALAESLAAPLITDLISAAWEGDKLTARRSVYGGKLTADLELTPKPVGLLTLRPGAMEPAAPGEPGAIIALAAGDPPDRLARRFLELIPAGGGVDLTKAKIIVSVGRGLEGPENLDLAWELAEALGAEVGCSRPVADQGWLEKDRQVGISGQTVKPKIYLALGISGAYQHQAGMGGAETIIAVNRDADAPIFDIAHYGVVADLFDVVPALIDSLKD